MKHIQTVAILGSTGTIGAQALKIISQHKGWFRISLLTAHGNLRLLQQQIETFQPEHVIVSKKDSFEKLSPTLQGTGINLHRDFAPFKRILIETKTNLVFNGISSIHGFSQSLETVESGIDLALANKESVLILGDLLIQTAEKNGTQIHPIDSEIAAVQQCLRGEQIENVKKVIITASGGPFFKENKKLSDHVNKAFVLNHPIWRMGEKISVDSATMMNKCFEVFEVHKYFGIPFDKITALIEPSAKLHAMVEFSDGRVKAAVGNPTMKGPIENALGLQQSKDNFSIEERSVPISNMHFIEPDQFPLFKKGLEFLKMKGNHPAALALINDYFVETFLSDKIEFHEMVECIKDGMDRFETDVIKMDVELKSLIKSINEFCNHIITPK